MRGDNPARARMRAMSRSARHPLHTASSRSRSGLPLLVLGGIAIGFSPIFVRLSEIGPVATGLYRLLLALPLLWFWMQWETRGAARDAAALNREAFLVPGILFAGDILFWHWSITPTTVANATLFANFAPMVVAFRAWFYLGEHTSFRFLIRMALAICGAALLVNASAALGARYVLGNMPGLITAGFFGSYMVVVARLRDRYRAATIMFYSSDVTCFALLIATLVSGESLCPRSASR